MRMKRLDEAIAGAACVLDALVTYRRIVESGCCKNCKNKSCGYVPDPGQLVRYNCPFFKRGEQDG